MFRRLAMAVQQRRLRVWMCTMGVLAGYVFSVCLRLDQWIIGVAWQQIWQL